MNEPNLTEVVKIQEEVAKLMTKMDDLISFS